jgi:hypothetical protein
MTLIVYSPSPAVFAQGQPHEDHLVARRRIFQDPGTLFRDAPAINSIGGEVLVGAEEAVWQTGILVGRRASRWEASNFYKARFPRKFSDPSRSFFTISA